MNVGVCLNELAGPAEGGVRGVPAVATMGKGKGHKAKAGDGAPSRVPGRLYERELFRLQAELVKVQEWVRTEGHRLAIIFEGRDAAGKGSTIKRTQRLSQPARRAHRGTSGAHRT